MKSAYVIYHCNIIEYVCGYIDYVNIIIKEWEVKYKDTWYEIEIYKEEEIL